MKWDMALLTVRAVYNRALGALPLGRDGHLNCKTSAYMKTFLIEPQTTEWAVGWLEGSDTWL